MEQSDLVIIGAGPAGLTAGLYAARAGLATVIYEKGYPGGLANSTDRIDNYPGFPEGIAGMELGEKMHEQAKRFGAEIATSDVERLWKEGDRIHASTGDQIRAARVAIVAAGSVPKKLGVPGEEELTGKGVSYCATCDGPLYKDRTVAVIGGGDSALQEALFLTRFAHRIIVIHRRKQFRAAKVLEQEVRKNSKVELALNKNIKGIQGDSSVEGVEVEDKETQEQEIIKADGVFLYVGYLPNVYMLGSEFKRDDDGFLLTDEILETSVPGVFAAGDVRTKKLRQVVTAVGDGALAAMAAYAYLEGHK
jgi:thioredoxin reductase (NADPH)